MNKFNFQKIDHDVFTATQGAWQQQLADNPGVTSMPYYQAALDYCKSAIDGKVLNHDGGGGIYGVIPEGSGHAAALIVVSYAKANEHLKMLSIYVQPVLNLSDSEPNYGELAWIASTAIVGCLEMTYKDYPAKQLKMLASFPLDKQFVTAITTALFGTTLAEHYEVTNHGQWIVVSKRGNGH